MKVKRVATRSCVSCGRVADSFCAGCGLTPYCSERCQRRDWNDRHRAVCHNLARVAEIKDIPDGTVIDHLANIPSPAPLRRPRSPVRDVKTEDRDDANSDRNSKVFPPGHITKPSTRTARGFGGPRSFSRPDKTDGRDGRPPRRDQSEEDWPAKPQRHNNFKQKKPWQNRNRSEMHFAKENLEDEENWDAPKQDSTPKPAPPINDEPAKPKATTPINLKPKPAPVHAPVQTTNQNGVQNRLAIQREVKKNPVAKQNEAKNVVTNQKPASVADVTPTRKLVPKDCLIECLSVGDTVLLSVDDVASECRSNVTGFVCLSLHENYESEYSALCEQYGAACESQTGQYTPTPGETFSYFNPEDGGWYRARCLSASEAALIDSARITALSNKHTRLPAAYHHQPEFCCLLQANVKVGDSLKCVLKEKTSTGYKVSLESVEDDRSVGEGTVSRWLPEVQYATPVPVAVPTVPIAVPTAPVAVPTEPVAVPTAPVAVPTVPVAVPAAPVAVPVAPVAVPAASTPGKAVIAPLPEVSRPALVNHSVVVLVHFESATEIYVRLADTATQRAFDSALHDAAMCGSSGRPMSEPPTQGQLVLSQFTDGYHYRAIVRRTSVKNNKYLLEYLEFGNSHVNTLENLYPCPESLSIESAPVVTSRASLAMTSLALTPPADSYLTALKDDSTELVLTLPSGSKSAPSGAEVILTVEKNKEMVNKKVEDMCTPEWMQLQQRGGDVLETESLMYSTLEYIPLPPGSSSLIVLDYGSLDHGALSGCPPTPLLQHVLTTLTDQMAKYCESEIGREPYLPKVEELCIAQCPPYPQWFRAVVAEQAGGAGGAEAEVHYIDYGNTERVATRLLRKMLPEFVRGVPALASTLQIRDFPKTPTADMITRAVEYLNPNDDGHGTLEITGWEEEAAGMYVVDAPALLNAMLAR